MGEVLVWSCRVADFNATTGNCAAPFYSFPDASGFPTLTIGEAEQIATAIALLWALAWSYKIIKRALQEIG